MMKQIIAKLMKSEFWMGLLGILASVLAPKLGVPEEQMSEVLLGIASITSVYIGGRSYSKPREMKNSTPEAPNP